MPTGTVGQKAGRGAITLGDDPSIVEAQGLSGAAHHMRRIEHRVVCIEEVQVLILHAMGQRALPVAKVDVSGKLGADTEDVDGLILRGRIIGDDFGADGGFGRILGEFDERAVHVDLH